MTHGVGSCSGGGGGGGGGFSGGFSGGSTYYHHGSRSGSGDCDPECQRCCEASVTGFGFILCLFLCCKDQNRNGRLGIMWFWIWLIFVCTALGVAFGSYGKNLYSTSPTDMRQVKHKLSSEFCSGVELSSPNKFSAYRLTGNPKLQDKKETYNISKSTSISVDTYEFWGFYLLAGSEVKIKSCVDYSATLYIIKGHNNLNKWIDDNDCNHCTVRSYSTGSCSTFYPDTFTINVYDEEEYYFVFANHGYISTSADIKFTLRKSVYDLTNNTEKCQNLNHCELHFSSLDSEESFVYEIPLSDNDDVEMYTSCIRRDWLFVILFLLLPVLLGSLGSLIIFLKFKNGKKGVSSTERNVINDSDREPLNLSVDRNHGSTYQSFVSPPSYEEAVKH